MKKLVVLLFSLSVQAQENPAVPVTTQPLSAVVIERQLSANAAVRAKHASTLSAEVNAVVQAIAVDTGDTDPGGDTDTDSDTLIDTDETDTEQDTDVDTDTGTEPPEKDCGCSSTHPTWMALLLPLLLRRRRR